MQILHDKLEQTGANSMFARNINPLRLALLLYETIDLVESVRGYYPFTSQLLKSKVLTQIVAMMETYKSPQQLRTIMMVPDHEGRNLFHYFVRHPLYPVLDTGVMDRLVADLWRGKQAYSGDIWRYMTSMQLINDMNSIYTDDDMFRQLSYHTFSLTKPQNYTHEY